MVYMLKRNKKIYFVCEECGLTYKEREWAKKCKVFCSKYNMCSLEITQHAVQLD